MFGFVETDICEGATHAKLLRHGKITETLFVNLSEKPSSMFVELRSTEDIGEQEYQAFYEKYEFLGFDFIEDSRRIAKSNGGYSAIYFTKVDVEDILKVASKIANYKP